MEEEIIEEEELTESDNYDEKSDDDPDWAKNTPGTETYKYAAHLLT
ncbi:hypothetical protein DOY81_010935 [Sarcophaga bullata]|nr:hypothetical protein DOY81_010935 [Sarcophaga bullata]